MPFSKYIRNKALQAQTARGLGRYLLAIITHAECITIANLLDNFTRMSKLQYVFTTIGDIFFKTLSFASVVKRYVYDEQPLQQKEQDQDVAIFSAETQSLTYLHSGILTSERERFRKFHDFTVMCREPMATVLLTTKDVCKNCNKQLSLDPKPHPVIIYSLHRGTYMGSRLSKICRKCKLHQYYGYCTQDGKKLYDQDSLALDFLLSTEDTAFDVQLLKECSNLLVMGAMPFSTYASSYNRRFGYNKTSK